MNLFINKLFLYICQNKKLFFFFIFFNFLLNLKIYYLICQLSNVVIIFKSAFFNFYGILLICDEFDWWSIKKISINYLMFRIIKNFNCSKLFTSLERITANFCTHGGIVILYKGYSNNFSFKTLRKAICLNFIKLKTFQIIFFQIFIKFFSQFFISTFSSCSEYKYYAQTKDITYKKKEEQKIVEKRVNNNWKKKKK